MNFENWWSEKRDSFNGSFCEKLEIKHHLKMGWDAHVTESMKPLTAEIKLDADKIKENADKLSDKINKL